MIPKFLRKHGDSAIVALLGVVVGALLITECSDRAARGNRIPEVSLPGVHASPPDSTPRMRSFGDTTTVFREFHDTTYFRLIRDDKYRALADKLCPGLEGYRSHPYDDARESQAVGCGLNLTLHGVSKRMAWTQTIMVLEENQATLRRSWPPFDEMSPRLQVALVEASYNLGVSGLLRFHAMTALATGDIPGAVAGFRDSEWYRNDLTRHRAERLIRVVQEER